MQATPRGAWSPPAARVDLKSLQATRKPAGSASPRLLGHRPTTHHRLRFTCLMRPTEVSAPPRNWRLSEGKTSEKDGAETDEFNEYSVLCPVDLIDDSLSEIGIWIALLSRRRGTAPFSGRFLSLQVSSIIEMVKR